MEKTNIIGVGMPLFGRFLDRRLPDLAVDAQGQIRRVAAENHAHFVLQQTELPRLRPTGGVAGVALSENGGGFNGYEEAAAVITLLQW